MLSNTSRVGMFMANEGAPIPLGKLQRAQVVSFWGQQRCNVGGRYSV